MTAVYVVRHPQTSWNVARRYQGRLDAPLSDLGQRQAEQLVSAFAGQRLRAVRSSPLGRARGLAQRIAETVGCPLDIDCRLIEMAQGPWEGLYLDEIRERYSDLFQEWYSRPDRTIFPGGEALADVRKRVDAVMRDLLNFDAGGDVLVVTHAVVTQMIVLRALRLPSRHLHRITVSNCGVTTLLGGSAPGTILSLNCTVATDGSGIQGLADAAHNAMDARRSTT